MVAKRKTREPQDPGPRESKVDFLVTIPIRLRDPVIQVGRIPSVHLPASITIGRRRAPEVDKEEVKEETASQVGQRAVKLTLMRQGEGNLL